MPVKVWVEVSEHRLAENFRAVAEATGGGGAEILAVVKANAYGHGAERCSVALARAGARWFGVTCAEEGGRVRRALEREGFTRGGERTPEILVMCGLLPEDVPALKEHGLTPVIWTVEHVNWLRSVAPMRVHVEVDTGMGRQGVAAGPRQPWDLLSYAMAAGLTVDGVMTHFSGAQIANSQLTQTQQKRFDEALAQVRAKGLAPSWVHAANSPAIDNPAQSWPWLTRLARSVGARPMVRPGIALYGYSLPIAGADAAAVAPRLRPALKPVMTWKTRVLAVHALKAGDTVGYNATFAARTPMQVALLPVGYADGLRRELSGGNERAGGWVMVWGEDKAARPMMRRAPIVGRISMNLTVVDVTGIANISAGDEVVLLGDGVTADDHARLAGTIPYEILCGVRER